MKNIFILTTVIFLFISYNMRAESYDLETFLSLVETNCKDLKLAEKELDMAKAYKKEAVSTALPKIFAQANYNRNLKENFLYIDFPDGNGGFTREKFKISLNNEYSFNAVLNQTLFSFKVGNALKAAKQYQKLTDFAYNARHQAIIIFAKKGFYQTLLLKKVWEVTRSAEENAHENYQNVKKKFDNGIVSEFELLQAEVRWKNDVPKTTKAKKNYQLALVSLKNFAGIDVEKEISLDGNFDHYPDKPERIDFEEILNERPDYNALLWEKKLRETNTSAQFSEYLPTLSGSFIYRFSSQSDEWRFDNRNNNLIAGLNLSIPIYTGGYTGAQVQKAHIELDKSTIKVDQTKENIYNEIKNITLRLEEAHQRILSAETTLGTSQKAFHIAEITADNGLATQLELKDSRVYLDQAKLNYYAAIYDYLDAYFDWELATGNVRNNSTVMY